MDAVSIFIDINKYGLKVKTAAHTPCSPYCRDYTSDTGICNGKKNIGIRNEGIHETPAYPARQTDLARDNFCSASPDLF